MISTSTILQGASSSILATISQATQFNATPIVYTEAGTGIRLENSAYKVSAQSAVSQQVLVSINSDGTTTKQYITDNIAPGPRTWQISGWITSNNLATALFTPVNLLGIDQTIKTQQQQLWTFFYKRALAKFRDKDGLLWPYVAIESLEFDADPNTQNKIPINIVIREVNVLTLDQSGVNTTAITNDPTSVYSPPTDLGAALTGAISDPVNTLTLVFTP